MKAGSPPDTFELLPQVNVHCTKKGAYMNTEKIAQEAVDKAQDVAKDVLDGAENAVHSTRKAVHSAAHKAERAIDEFGN